MTEQAPEEIEFGALRVPLGWAEPQEQPVPEGAEAVLAHVADGLFVEVHYRFPVGAPMIPRRVGVANLGSRILSGRHFGSVFAHGQAWHVIVEVDQE